MIPTTWHSGKGRSYGDNEKIKNCQKLGGPEGGGIGRAQRIFRAGNYSVWCCNGGRLSKPIPGKHWEWTQMLSLDDMMNQCRFLTGNKGAVLLGMLMVEAMQAAGIWEMVSAQFSCEPKTSLQIKVYYFWNMCIWPSHSWRPSLCLCPWRPLCWAAFTPALALFHYPTQILSAESSPVLLRQYPSKYSLKAFIPVDN